MKKINLLISLIVIAVLISACGGNQVVDSGANINTGADDVVANGNASAEAGSTNGEGEPLANFADREVPLMTQLMLGTFGLEDTKYAVTSEQAAQLLPLWQVMNSLLNSDTVAQEEIDAVINQIANTMTEEQMQAITDMELSNQSTFAMMEELGLNTFQPPEDIEDGEESQRPEGMGAGAGGGPGAGGGQGFGGGGGETGLSPEEMESMQATREAGGFGGGQMGGVARFSNVLIEPLIELLEGKIS